MRPTQAFFILFIVGMFYPDELDQIFCGTVKSFLPWEYKVQIVLYLQFIFSDQ